MSPVPQRSGAADEGEDTSALHAPRLTIGEVLARLRGDFPDVTISKIRYLESEDLVHPQRTPSGYRKFSGADVGRLRYVLAAQRDQYLPLRVIKEHLDAIDRGETPPVPAPAVQEAPVPPPSVATAPAPAEDASPASTAPAADAPATLTASDFALASGLADDQLSDCVHYGLLTPDAGGRHRAADLPIGRAAAGFARFGLGQRHLRLYRTGAEREAGMVEQLVAPLLHARSDEARTRAAELLAELSALSAQLHAALLDAHLRDLLRP